MSLHLLPDGVTWAHYAAMGATVLVGSCMQGIGGVGFAMISAPVATLFFPELAPGPLLLLGGVSALFTALREWRDIDWPAASAALVGRAGGTVVAVACLALLPARLLALMFALLILAGVVLSLSGWKVVPSRANMLGAGVASGLMGTMTSAGAPPFAIVMQHLPPQRVRATLGCVFFVGAAFSLFMLANVQRFGRAQFWLSASLTPLMALGLAVSGPLNRRVSRQGVRQLLLALSALGALGVLLKVILWD